MNNFFKILFTLLNLIFLACSNSLEIDSISYSKVDIIGPSDSNFSSIIKIYKDSIDLKDPIIGKSENLYTKDDFDKVNFNSSLGNLIADIIYHQADSVFKTQYGKNIDFVLQNHGGIRASLLKGDIKISDAYKILPFENEIVIVETGEKTLTNIINFLNKESNPHPISGLKIKSGGDFEILNKSNSENYFIATNDYLLSGGDDMFFLQDNIKVYNLGYSLRDAFINYIKKEKNIRSKVDSRFIKSE